MKRYTRLIALVGVLALAAAACGEEGAPPAADQGEEAQRGGTFLAGLESDVDAAFDPQKEYYSVTWGFYHCCLLRTLVTTPSTTADNGGNDLQPDLATDLPEVSEDGLTYTFTIKDGVTFGPPYQDQEITAQSFINALEREATPAVGAGYPFYYSVIEGFDAFSDGEADSITGLTAVDEKTLEITLSRPAGDFPFRMMMPAAAPIPDGAADGHNKDYGRFLISSGPYMLEGADQATAPPAEPFPGYEPGQSIVMVRNPSWDPATDELREAYLDRIEVQIGLTADDGALRVDSGDLHMMLDAVPPPQQIQAYQGDPERRDQLFSNVGDGTYYISMNIAEPPLDDLAVRRAVNFALDRAGLLQIRGGPLFGEVATHAITDPLTGFLLEDYDPYPSPDGSGDIEAAQAEMAQSAYDSDGDGVCDDPVCENIVSVTDEADPYPDQSALITQGLEPLGLTLDVTTQERTTMYDSCNDPGAHVAFCLGAGWFKDYSDATTFGEALFGSVAIGPDSCCNYALVGAPSDVLEEHGYDVTEVPSVDADFQACDEMELGDERVQCWADFDRKVTEEIVPWVPINFARDVFVIGDAVRGYDYDQFSSQPDLAGMSLAGGGSA
ncbi:MAG TPA: ABC transporter substrate-binding protein [Actinomycetota bacterium]|nr:ABC transporter substrate-binding protein [Actinomycetota bacterium]